MALKKAKLVNKISLTHDVYELHFESEEIVDMKPGQFITFLLPVIGGRAYSILDIDNHIIKLVIKKWEKENGGRGGSIKICDSEIGDELNFVGPAGHFILQENNKSKLFIGTGTGLVPLYNQILGSVRDNSSAKLELLFGVRFKKDIYYTNELDLLKSDNFGYEIFLSQEETPEYHKGYITGYLNKEYVSSFEEFYICGAPAMIDSTIEKLQEHGINEEQIFTERY